jgi:hypothetical protein
MSYSVCLSFCTFFSVSRHISYPTIWASHFPRMSLFSPYSRSYNVSFSFSLLVSFIAIFQVLQWAFLIFHDFQCFLPYSRSYSACVSFSMFFSFLNKIQVLQFVFLNSRFLLFLSIFQVIQCLCLIFHVFQFSFHYTVPTVCISHI